MVRSPCDLGTQLRILKDLFYSVGMIVNTNKMKVMIIKSKNITYHTFVYGNNNLEEVPSYKYLIINIHYKFSWNYSIEKRINGGWISYYGLENYCKLADLCYGIRKKRSLRLLLLMLSYMNVKFGDAIYL
jgi:hypothetical protein